MKKLRSSASDLSPDLEETEDGISQEMKELANSIENQIGQLEDLEADSDGAPEEKAKVLTTHWQIRKN